MASCTSEKKDEKTIDITSTLPTTPSADAAEKTETFNEEEPEGKTSEPTLGLDKNKMPGEVETISAAIKCTESGNATPTSSDEEGNSMENEATANTKSEKRKLNEFTVQKGLKEPIFISNETKDGYETTVSIDWLEFKSLETHIRKQDAEQDAAKVVFSKLFQLYSENAIANSTLLKTSKSRLQEITQKWKNRVIPSYATRQELNGCYTSTLQVDDQIFKSIGTHNRKKDAEENAAKAALAVLGDVESNEDTNTANPTTHDILTAKMSPKNYLQELLQKTRQDVPTYNTLKSGFGIFTSKVTYEGKEYAGNGPNKKTAEASAAKNVLEDILKIDLSNEVMGK